MILTALILSAIRFFVYEIYPVQVKRLRSPSACSKPVHLNQSVRFLHTNDVLQVSRCPPAFAPRKPSHVPLIDHIYYLPFCSYFRAIKGTSAQGLGVHTLPCFMPLTVDIISNGFQISRVDSYISFLVFRAVMKTIAAVFILTTLKVSTTTDRHSPGSRFASSQISIK